MEAILDFVVVVGLELGFEVGNVRRRRRDVAIEIAARTRVYMSLVSGVSTVAVRDGVVFVLMRYAVRLRAMSAKRDWVRRRRVVIEKRGIVVVVDARWMVRWTN